MISAESVEFLLLLPAHQVLGGRVAVGALDGRRAVLGDLREELGGEARRRVVRVDQHGEPCRVGGGHPDIVAHGIACGG
jgi:hypothetical protein